MYKQGSIITLKEQQFQLLFYRGEYRRKKYEQRIFKVPQKEVTEDGREHAYYEMWDGLNLNTGQVDLLKCPVYVFHENQSDYALKDRTEVIDDTNEVTSLLDSLDCWFSKSRDRKNFHLDIINDRHIAQIERLRQLDENETNTNFKIGIRLKLMQKEHPNLDTLKALKDWKLKFPELFTKLSRYVYQNSVISSTDDNTVNV